MKKIILATLLIILVGSFLNGCEKDLIPEIINPTPPIVGNDRDEHGCIGSAGYTWCNEKLKCIRTWEEGCARPTESEIIEMAQKAVEENSEYQEIKGYHLEFIELSQLKCIGCYRAEFEFRIPKDENLDEIDVGHITVSFLSWSISEITISHK